MPNRSHKEKMVRWLVEFGREPTKERAQIVVEAIYALFPLPPHRHARPRRSGLLAELRDRVCEAYEAGATQEALGKASGYGQPHVSKLLKARQVIRGPNDVLVRTTFSLKRASKQPLREVDGVTHRCCGQCLEYRPLEQYYPGHHVCIDCSKRIVKVAALLKRIDELREQIGKPGDGDEPERTMDVPG